MNHTVIFGATSAIATATARRCAARGDSLYLLARDADRLSLLAEDLRIRGAAAVMTAPFDAMDTAAHGRVVARVFAGLPSVDLLLLAHGSLPDQRACERDSALTLAEIGVNGLGTISLLVHIANHLAEQGHGCVAVVTSVAGERGRQSNYTYGAAKSLVSTFLQGLRNRLQPCGVRVLDIRPGFVDTPMTAAFDKGVLWTRPETVARIIERAVRRRRNLVYAPFYWRYIMWVIRALPEALFKRLKL